MNQTSPEAAASDSLPAWYDSQMVDNVVLYDITREAATLLSAVLLERMDNAADERDREHWKARRRLVKQQVKALNPKDRAGLTAQQEAWVHEIQALTDLPSQ